MRVFLELCLPKAFEQMLSKLVSSRKTIKTTVASLLLGLGLGLTLTLTLISVFRKDYQDYSGIVTFHVAAGLQEDILKSAHDIAQSIRKQLRLQSDKAKKNQGDGDDDDDEDTDGDDGTTIDVKVKATATSDKKKKIIVEEDDDDDEDDDDIFDEFDKGRVLKLLFVI